jgi:hypothetical protein
LRTLEYEFEKLTVEKFKMLFKGCRVVTKDGRRFGASAVRLKDIKYRNILKVVNQTMNLQYVSGDPVGRILRRRNEELDNDA